MSAATAVRDLTSYYLPGRARSPSPSDSDGRPVSPIEGMKKSPSSSTVESISYECPKLPAVVCVRQCELRKGSAGWGFTLKGTTCELCEGQKVYHCHVESVHEKGAAKVAGLVQGDQIVRIEGMTVKDKLHSEIVSVFQAKDRVSITILPARYRTCYQTRVTNINRSAIDHLWALGRFLHSLEIINVNLEDEAHENFAFDTFVSLQSLSLNHCSIKTLESLKGLESLHRLESLSLAHNFLTHDAVDVLASLTSLKRIDLSHNLLNKVPEVLYSVINLEVLLLVKNNISELPKDLKKLSKLSMLCIDGNLLREVDKALKLLPCMQKVTLSNNNLETESLAIKHGQFLITSINGNPFTSPDQTGLVTRKEPSLRRTLSVRGGLVLNEKQMKHIHRLSLESCNGTLL